VSEYLHKSHDLTVLNGFVIVISVDGSIAGGIAGNGGYLLLLCHFPAFFSALMTGRSALLTMLRFLFGAFIAARLTNLSA
jgi:hypothetical protein